MQEYQVVRYIHWAFLEQSTIPAAIVKMEIGFALEQFPSPTLLSDCSLRVYAVPDRRATALVFRRKFPL